MEKKTQKQEYREKENGSIRFHEWPESRETPLFGKWKGVIPGDKRNDEIEEASIERKATRSQQLQWNLTPLVLPSPSGSILLTTAA